MNRQEPWKELRVDFESSLPLSVQLSDQVTWLIVSGKCPKGTLLPPIRILADHLGINLHTVRAAYKKLEADKLISTRQGVGSVVLEYQPHHKDAVNGLPSHVIGLLIPDLGGPFYSALLTGIQSLASEHQMFVIVSSTSENLTKAHEQLNMLAAKRVDGILIASDYLDQNGKLANLDVDSKNIGIPIVHIDRPDISKCSVSFDAEDMGYSATRHLAAHGCDRIGLITASCEFPTFRDCCAGYRRAMTEAGYSPNPADIVEADGFTMDAGFRAAEELLQREDPPRAIFIAEDLLAIGAIKSIRARGLRIPEDIALVGANNFEISSYIIPSLTTIYTSAKEIGEEAMRLLIQLLDGGDIRKTRITLPVSLVIRGSCGCGDDL